MTIMSDISLKSLDSNFMSNRTCWALRDKFQQYGNLVPIGYPKSWGKTGNCHSSAAMIVSPPKFNLFPR